RALLNQSCCFVNEVLGFGVLGPARLIEDLPQVNECGPGLLALSELVLCHGQECQRRWGTVVPQIGRHQGLDRLPVTTGAVEGPPEAEAILPPIRSKAAGVLRLEQGEAILKGVEVGLADEGPALLVICLWVFFLVIAIYQRECHLPRRGP